MGYSMRSVERVFFNKSFMGSRNPCNIGSTGLRVLDLGSTAKLQFTTWDSETHRIEWKDIATMSVDGWVIVHENKMTEFWRRRRLYNIFNWMLHSLCAFVKYEGPDKFYRRKTTMAAPSRMPHESGEFGNFIRNRVAV